MLMSRLSESLVHEQSTQSRQDALDGWFFGQTSHAVVICRTGRDAVGILGGSHDRRSVLDAGSGRRQHYLKGS